MSGSTENIEWYLARDGQQFGPVTETELQKVIEFGHLKPDDLVWRAGFDEWREAGDVFAAELARSTPATEPETETPSEEAPAAAATPPATTTTEPAKTEADKPKAAPQSEEAPAKAAPEEARKPAETKADPAKAPAATTASAEAPSRKQDARPHAKTAPSSPHPGSRAEEASGPRADKPAGQQPAAGQPPHPGHISAAAAEWAAAQQRVQDRTQDRTGTGQPSAAGAPTDTAQLRTQPYRRGQERSPENWQPGLEPAGQHPGPTSAGAGQPQEARHHSRQLDWNAPRGDRPPSHSGEALPARADPYHPDYDDPLPPPPRRRSALATITLSLLAALIVGTASAGAWYVYTERDTVEQLFNQLTGKPRSGEPAIVAAPDTPDRVPATASTNGAAPSNTGESAAVATLPATSPAAVTQPAPAPEPPKPPIPLMTTSLWKSLETSFPEWAANVAQKVERERQEAVPDEKISTGVVQAMVQLRRKNASAALTAPPAQLTAIAQSFVANLRFLRQSSVEACYGFIAEGELSKSVLPLYTHPDKSGPLANQSIAIIQAIKASQQSPTKYAEPAKKDFDTLSAKLANRGWSRDDLRLFSDPAALSRAPQDQVCRLVTEWFETQLALPDGEQKMRLLTASLNPVVAG